MGAGHSSPQERPPTMVFRGESDIPIRFSASLINSLEKRQKNGSAPVAGAGLAEAEAMEAEIERRVAERVVAERARLEAQEKALARRESELIDAAVAAATPASPVAPTPGDGRSVSIVAQDAEELIRQNKITILKPPNPSIAKVQQDVEECYRVNKGKPLDCWREVDRFRVIVRAAQQEFVSSHG